MWGKIIYFFRTLLHKMFDGKNVSIDIHNRIGSHTILCAQNGGKIFIKRFFHTQRNVTVHADGGNIIIGENVFLNENCMVVSHDKITINDNVTIGPNVCIYDHDHNYKGTGYVASEVYIGKNVWIGANAVILRGSYLGDGCVVGAGTIIKGKYEEMMLITQNKECKIKKIVAMPE